MITYLDLAIPVYVAGAAIFLVPTLVFRQRKVGKQDLTLVEGNICDFDFRADTPVPWIMRSPISCAAFIIYNRLFPKNDLDQSINFFQEPSELLSRVIQFAGNNGLVFWGQRLCTGAPFSPHCVSALKKSRKRAARTSVYRTAGPRLRIRYRLLMYSGLVHTVSIRVIFIRSAGWDKNTLPRWPETWKRHDLNVCSPAGQDVWPWAHHIMMHLKAKMECIANHPLKSKSICWRRNLQPLRKFGCIKTV